MIQIFGKKSFVSKKGDTLFMIYYGQRSDQTEGMEAFSEFVNSEVFSKVQVNGRYDVVFGRNYSGKAVIQDVIPITR